LIDSFIKGINGLLFAYGITNAGKTYTITGTKEEPGILPRTLNSIFRATQVQSKVKGNCIIVIVTLCYRTSQGRVEVQN
jgi:hypothetical protein